MTLLAATAGLLLAVAPSQASILVTEPFDYNVGVWSSAAGTQWTTTMGGGSGIGWGANNWFSHIGAGLQFGIATGGHTGTFADSTGLNYNTSHWRERDMSPAVQGNTDGAVTWQYLTVSITGTGTAGELTTQNANGGEDFAVRVEADGTYTLSAGYSTDNQTQTSTIAASQSAAAPDIVVVKMVNETGTGLFDVFMWVNPTATTEAGLPAPDLQLLSITPFSSNRNIGSLNWMPGTTQIDNFKLASAYEDFGIGLTGPLIGVMDGATTLTDGASTVNFGSAVAGVAVIKTLTITNGGTSDLTLGTISTDGTDAADFVAGTPGTSTLTPGSTTTFTVTFTPSTAGAKAAAIHIASNAPGVLNPFDIALAGTGLPPIGVLQGTTALTDGSSTVDFGSSLAGVAVNLTFTITNEGPTDLTLSGVSTDGTDAADFVAGAPGTSTLTPGSSTTFTVTFTPSTYAAEAAAIHIASDAPGDLNPFDIALTGTGLAPIGVQQGAETLADGSSTVNFGLDLIGAAVSKTFVITNQGPTDLTLGAISEDGADAVDFAVGALGTTSLTPGSSTTFTVTFTPSANGAEAAAIHIASDAPGDLNPFDIALAGAGHLPGATIVVTEPFDYNVGIWTQSGAPDNNWTAGMGSGSGIGWGANNWFSHLNGGVETFGIATGGHTGTFADSTGLNYLSNHWRERDMSPAVFSNDDGDVIWQSLTVSITGTGTAGELTTQDSYGGEDFAVRVEASGTYTLSAGYSSDNKTQASSIAASGNASAPDLVVVKMVNETGTGLFDVFMWINPTAATESDLPAPDMQILGVTPFAGNRNIGSLNWMPGTTQIDNYQLAGDYADFGISATTPTPPTFPLSGFTLPGGVPTFVFPTTSGHKYRIVYADTIETALGSWQPLIDGNHPSPDGWSATSTGADDTITDLAPSPAHRFYRLEMQ